MQISCLNTLCTTEVTVY